MAITKAKKEEIVSKLDAGLKDAETVAFVNFHGLSVGEVTELRKTLREKGVTYFVAKKTLVGRVLDTKEIGGDRPAFPGELAVAWSTDPLAAPKSVADFAATRKEKLALVGGIYQGAYLSKDEVTALAAIPGMETLRGMFVGLLSNSIGGVVRVLNAQAEKLEGAQA